ncbi:MAG: hypothetical protein HN778_18395 [Prolixibacteraceae bacterium]|nr:hypothetical protein [Prolixibacteraceae bacterium]MBT6765277.1 hypothetical protein [Prolixibacteraceae bacterium]MBT6997791.1 hypothetical protein [Prolixibacteraceae bacterium]MBT7396804.1 hypothetical protein [Prolixibacteraceae bacterium]
MKKISRRNFIKNTSKLSSGLVILGTNTHFLSSCSIKNTSEKKLKIFIPMPIQVVIDDVGWWSGKDGSKKQEPYRTGINRNHVPNDYLAIAELGRELGIRPQAAIILCEWDKKNILRQLPTSTWMSEKWDNSKWVGQWLEETAEIIRNNKNHFELTVHGIGHEYWEGGNFTRAEWTDSKGQMRPQDQVELHLDYFEKLMNQHNLGSFPNSFVPTAFRHSFGPSEGRNISLAEILEKRGITYINSPFEGMYNNERIQHELFGFDAGVMTIDRGSDEFPWDTFPGNPSMELTGPTCGMHWPNMLHPNPERNSEVVQKWVNYLKPYNEKQDMMLAPDSVAFQNQLVHQTLTKTQLKRNSIKIDFTETDKLPSGVGMGELTLKIVTDKPTQFKSEDIKIKSQTLQRGSKFLYNLILKRKAGKLKVNIIFDSAK